MPWRRIALDLTLLPPSWPQMLGQEAFRYGYGKRGARKDVHVRDSLLLKAVHADMAFSDKDNSSNSRNGAV